MLCAVPAGGGDHIFGQYGLSSTLRLTAMRRSSGIRLRSAWTAAPTPTWPSAWASTSAWVPTSHASSSRQSSVTCSPGLSGSSWMAGLTGLTRPSTVGSNTSDCTAGCCSSGVRRWWDGVGTRGVHMRSPPNSGALPHLPGVGQATFASTHEAERSSSLRLQCLAWHSCLSSPAELS